MNDQSTNMMNQHQQQHMMSMNPNPQMMSMNQHQQQQMVNRGYGLWGPPLVPPMDQLKFQNPNPNMNAPLGGGGGFVSGKQHLQGSKVLGPRINWKGKKVNDKRKDGRRNENFNIPLMTGTSSGPGGISGGGGGYKPPMLKELQHQNRVKAQRFFTKKKFNHNNNNNNNFNFRNNNMGKFAPRNTSSFLIRAKKSGGIAELVSPCPVTPAVLPTPMFSPSREDLVDMAKEEWGVDGYGSMKGFIRLRTPGSDDEDEDEDGGSSESDVEEHAEMEKRLDHDLSRFEMIYPNCNDGIEYNNNNTNNSNVLENRVDDQDTHIAQLEEENMILKEKLFLMEREFDDLRRRLQFLERQGGQGGGEEVVENESENDSGDVHSMEFNNEGSTEVNEGVKSNDIQSANEDGDNDQNVADAGVKEIMEQNNDVSDVHKDKLTQTRKQEE